MGTIGKVRRDGNSTRQRSEREKALHREDERDAVKEQVQELTKTVEGKINDMAAAEKKKKIIGGLTPRSRWKVHKRWVAPCECRTTIDRHRKIPPTGVMQRSQELSLWRTTLLGSKLLQSART